MKNYIRAAIAFALIGAILALILLSTLPAEAGGRCVLHKNKDGQSVTIVGMPCWYRDFPKNCKVPKKIMMGQKIHCPTKG